MIEPAVAIFIDGQKEGVLMASLRLSLFILTPERGRKRPDIGVGQARLFTPGELFTDGKQRATGLLGHGKGFGNDRQYVSGEGEADDRVLARRFVVRATDSRVR